MTSPQEAKTFTQEELLAGVGKAMETIRAKHEAGGNTHRLGNITAPLPILAANLIIGKQPITTQMVTDELAQFLYTKMENDPSPENSFRERSMLIEKFSEALEISREDMARSIRACQQAERSQVQDR